MNKSKIDWCDYTWNPVTGCLHGCDYCYANKIAKRFADKSNLTYVDGVKPSHLKNIPYPYGFLPTFHVNRLEEPISKKKASVIFVTSMGDLFGDWVPDEWIYQVFNATAYTPHTYIFLTKNPDRYERLKLPVGKYYFGASATSKEEINVAMKSLFNAKMKHQNIKTFLSIEPLMKRIPQLVMSWMNLSSLDWIIVGGLTGNKSFKQQKTSCLGIIESCKKQSIPVFVKNNMEIKGAPQVYPW